MYALALDEQIIKWGEYIKFASAQPPTEQLQ